ncbi:MAG: thioredoxin domain-containing protein, partial [Firmicutes bacterium]|nr:thioredoxin domain-containing protein [Bacillota bacterium]
MRRKPGGKIMNHLKGQTSPYLLQHAENPVDWYPWCEEAFDRARREEKPIFLSIGYSTCHWCHVMAEESFEDKDVASMLNSKFISIKVDREERPDLDAVYMAVCQTMTGSGGWPMTIFMTADQKPFFAGTYFPKHSSRGMTGFLELLSAVAEAWRTRRGELLNTAEGLLSHLRQTAGRGEEKTLDYETGKRILEKAVQQLKREFDSEHGGFGMAPKFPMGHNLLFLMQQYEQTGDEELLQMAEKTLLQMYKGGIFDHLGGGFSRYSTDKYFLAPHFEKM